MVKKSAALFVMIVCALFMSTPAFAALTAVGPTNPVSGFPLWYQDANGIQAELPVPPLVTPTATMIFDPPGVNAFSNTIGFGAEAMYWYAESSMPVAGGGDALLVLALEAAFNTETPVKADAMVFTRIRIRIDTPVAGTYTVTHPYGTVTFPNVPAGTRAINETVDIGTCPGVFSAALGGNIGPFLRQVNPAPPAGWIGDGLNEATVIGSPTGNNFFRITGPGINPNGSNTITNNLFLVSGHRFGGGGVTPPPPVPTNEVITISFAKYNVAKGKLVVKATSNLAGTVLRVSTPALGTLSGGQLSVVTPKPASVTVTSSGGGTATAVVTNMNRLEMAQNP